MLHTFLLLLRERTEKLDLLLVGRLPLVVHLECTLKMLFDLDIKCLWLDVDEGWVVDTWDGLRWDQMMKVSCQLCELCARCLLLTLLLLNAHLALILTELLPDLLVLGLDVIQVGLPCIEVVLVFPWVVPAITIDDEVERLNCRKCSEWRAWIFILTISRWSWPSHDRKPSAVRRWAPPSYGRRPTCPCGTHGTRAGWICSFSKWCDSSTWPWASSSSSGCIWRHRAPSLSTSLSHYMPIEHLAKYVLDSIEVGVNDLLPPVLLMF